MDVHDADVEAKMNVIDVPHSLEEVAVLGVASTDTKGGALTGEDVGTRHTPGIAED